MRYLSHNEINHALVRGHFERSKQFHSLLSRLFRSNETSAARRSSKHRTPVKSRTVSA
ncbi:hypothetical protein [uncultured Cohaesibacter sp.]|uniref:hypothetical protein n=1 Tax=uncultured Cohaesibacter sp. TaxID=1002546 RepID=UPI002AA6C5D2|nr:hypothetical protein [uncultured Cohaesibacter sp.]